MVKHKLNVWDIIAWIVLALILLWLILKTFGIINTPLWLQYAPLYGAIYLAGWYAQKLEGIGKGVDELNNFRGETIKKINNIELNCAKNHN